MTSENRSSAFLKNKLSVIARRFIFLGGRNLRNVARPSSDSPKRPAEPIPEARRRPEAALWAAFEEERSRILGVLLDAVPHGLSQLPNTHLEKLPRMADFAVWRRHARPHCGRPVPFGRGTAAIATRWWRA